MKDNIQLAEKWPEMVAKWAFVIVIRFDSDYIYCEQQQNKREDICFYVYSFNDLTYLMYHSTFFVQVGHENTYALVEKSFFLLNHVIIRPTKIMNNLHKVCQIRTFKVIKKQTNLSDFFFCEEYLTRISTFVNEIFLKL